MLRIDIPRSELWDEVNEEYVYIDKQTLQLEHSLVSISKWESKWHKPFLSEKQKTRSEILDYIRCMTITQNVNPNVYLGFTNVLIDKVNKYIEDPMTATTFREDKKRSSREIITSELIYYWMVAYGIPFECQKWHLNRLLTLIRICGIKNQEPKKMSKKDIMGKNAAINAMRRSKMHSRG